MLHLQTTTIGILMYFSSESLLSSSLINVNYGDKLLLASFIKGSVVISCFVQKKLLLEGCLDYEKILIVTLDKGPTSRDE
jgi:hypothetical protein